MSYRTALARGRRAAERLMSDTGTLRRQTGTTFDEATGTETPVWQTVYQGKGKLQRSDTQVLQTDAGGSEVHVGRSQLHLPHDVEGVQVGDEWTVDDALQSSLEGRVFVVTGLPSKSHQTAQRFEVEEQQQ